MKFLSQFTPADKLMIKIILVIITIGTIMIMSSCAVYPEKMLVVSHRYIINKGDTISYITRLNQKDTIRYFGYLKPGDTTLLKKISTPERLEYKKSMVNNY